MNDNETLEKRGLWLSILGALFNLVHCVRNTYHLLTALHAADGVAPP